jgi:hypothetical protein
MSVAFGREESAEAAQEVSLPLRAISAHPNLVTQSGLRALLRHNRCLRSSLIFRPSQRILVAVFTASYYSSPTRQRYGDSAADIGALGNQRAVGVA